MVFSFKYLIKIMYTIGLLQSILCEVKSSNKALWEKVEQLERKLDETSVPRSKKLSPSREVRYVNNVSML